MVKSQDAEGDLILDEVGLILGYNNILLNGDISSGIVA
jgi:hypothetical protein